jgi:predicted enzyme related to lactoylglutathione lyase
MFQGLRTVICHVPDLAQAKAWFSKAFGTQPYFDEAFYVGFNIGGYEFGLQPAGDDVRVGTNVVTYWGVPDIDAGVSHMLSAGAQPREPISDVGEGIKVASVVDPFGNVIGLIENPHFRADA